MSENMKAPGMLMFPEEAYRKRFKEFRSDRSDPCGTGCAYNCCDPIIASVILLKEKALPRLFSSIEQAVDDLLRDIQGDTKALDLLGYFIAPSFFKNCFDDGTDFGIKNDQERYIQIYLLLGCPNLKSTGLCAIYGGRRLRLCENFKGCPEFRMSARTTEDSFVSLAFNYWLMRRLISRHSEKDLKKAIAKWQANESGGKRFFLRNEQLYTDLIYGKEWDW